MQTGPLRVVQWPKAFCYQPADKEAQARNDEERHVPAIKRRVAFDYYIANDKEVALMMRFFSKAPLRIRK